MNFMSEWQGQYYISFLPREYKINIFEVACNVLFIIKIYGVFADFPKISQDSPKLVRNSHKRCRTFSEKFRRLPKTF